MSNSIENYTLASNRFMRLNRGLRAHLLERMVEEGGILSRFKDAFVTGNSILAGDVSRSRNRRGGARQRQVRPAPALLRAVGPLGPDIGLGGDGEDELSELDLERVARDLGVEHAELVAAATIPRRALRAAQRPPGRTVRRVLRPDAGGVLRNLPPREELDPQEARILFRFLVEVTTVVLQFLALVPAQYAMIAEGVHTERVFGQGVSLISAATCRNR